MGGATAICYVQGKFCIGGPKFRMIIVCDHSTDYCRKAFIFQRWCDHTQAKCYHYYIITIAKCVLVTMWIHYT